MQAGGKLMVPVGGSQLMCLEQEIVIPTQVDLQL